MPRSTKTVSLNQLRVGIFVLVSIVVLIFLILNASGDMNPFKKRLHLKARFADANALTGAGARGIVQELSSFIRAAKNPFTQCRINVL